MDEGILLLDIKKVEKFEKLINTCKKTLKSNSDA